MLRFKHFSQLEANSEATLQRTHVSYTLRDAHAEHALARASPSRPHT